MKKHRSSENQDFEASEKANLLLLYKFFPIDEACYCLKKFSRNFFLLAPFTRIDEKCRFWAFLSHNSRSVILSVLIILKKVSDTQPYYLRISVQNFVKKC